MHVDFYQLSRDPAEAVLPLLAANTLKAGERMLGERDGVERKFWVQDGGKWREGP